MGNEHITGGTAATRTAIAAPATGPLVKNSNADLTDFSGFFNR
jgi:hypothetical protein